MVNTTDRLLLTAGISTQNVHLSLDKLTVVGDFINTQESISILQGCTDVLHETMSKYPYRWNLKTVSGTVIQIAEDKAPVPQVRVEFNPNNQIQTLTGQVACSLMKYKRPTRIDYALDYPVDLSSWMFATTNSRSTTAYYSQSGKLETLYLGSQHSVDKYRIYNKALELGTDETLWRIEQELRFKPDDDWQFTIPFSDLYVVLPYSCLPVEDLMILDGLKRNPEYWGHLSRRHREKYRKLLKSASMQRLNPWPTDAYFYHAQPCVDYLTQILQEQPTGSAGRRPVAISSCPGRAPDLGASRPG